jgi:glycosyltransferase involved in cell wall biosynthesis
VTGDLCRVSVVLCTFNRAHLLGPAMDAVLSQIEGSPPYEVVLVDNNSRDHTRELVQERQATAGPRLRYVFEAQQGLSFARNAGIDHARADLVAFTDDDIRVAPNWVSSIQKAFDMHADVDCVGGRILPEWSAPPPRWLTRNVWVGALALQDYGPERFIVERTNPVCLAGANLSFRKDVFDEIGGFSTEFGSRSEDTELMTRFWISGRRAMYVPEIAVAAPVSEDRMTKEYFRAWHVRTGSYARLAEEVAPRANGHPALRRVLGIPLFAIRELAGHASSWISESLHRREAEAFWHECQLREIAGYMRDSRARHCRTRARGLTATTSSGQSRARTRL